jgi:hypothetical protein
MWLAFSGIMVIQLFAILPIGYIAVAATIEASKQPAENVQMASLYATEYRVSQQQLHGLPGWQGVDITSGCGSPIYAPFSGIVTYQGLDGYNHVDNRGVVWEQATMLTIQGNNGLELTLLHGNYSVSNGDEIIARQVIGTEASNGWSTGCHSHVILKQNGQTLNFLTWQNEQKPNTNELNVKSAVVTDENRGEYQHRTGTQLTGFLSGYDKLPTDGTIQNRQNWGQIPSDLSKFDALIAVLDCNRIGETGTLHTNLGNFYILVFDCAGIADGGANWMIDGNYVAELDWYTRNSHPELIGTEATLVFDQ